MQFNTNPINPCYKTHIKRVRKLLLIETETNNITNRPKLIEIWPKNDHAFIFQCLRVIVCCDALSQKWGVIFWMGQLPKLYFRD